MKSTCVLPPLSDILYNNNNSYNHQYSNHHSNNNYHHHHQSHQQRYNNTRPLSHSVLHVSNLLSSNNSEEDLDEYDDEPVKAKRKRASPSQLSVLNRVFQQTFFPSTELRMELGKQLGMSPRTVQIWFQNKRQSIRTRERITPPVSPYSKPSHISLPPLRLHNQQQPSWPLTPCSPTLVLFRDS